MKEKANIAHTSPKKSPLFDSIHHVEMYFPWPTHIIDAPMPLIEPVVSITTHIITLVGYSLMNITGSRQLITHTKYQNEPQVIDFIAPSCSIRDGQRRLPAAKNT